VQHLGGQFEMSMKTNTSEPSGTITFAMKMMTRQMTYFRFVGLRQKLAFHQTHLPLGLRDCHAV